MVRRLSILTAVYLAVRSLAHAQTPHNQPKASKKSFRELSCA
jgi:hypothetical protein